MAQKENKIIRRRIKNAYLSSVISISLVLLLIGVAAMLLVNAESVSDYFKENIRVSVIFKSDVQEKQAEDFRDVLDKKRFVKEAEFISKEQGEKEMKALLGEDFLEVFETSPIPVSYNVMLKAEYVSTDSLMLVEKELMVYPIVDEIVYQKSLVEKLNSNLSKISAVFAIFIALLLFISFVLINNVMRLSVFDKRFSIHTMRLVGATKSFIRSPFLARAALLGLISSVLAMISLAVLIIVLKVQFAQLFDIIRMSHILIVFGIVIVSGLAICVVSTYFVVGKLVSLSNDELYY